MTEAPNTLTPEVLLEMAKIEKKFPILGDSIPLDDLVGFYSRVNAIVNFRDTIFNGRWALFYEAVFAFLKSENYIPDVPEEKISLSQVDFNEEDFDSFDMLNERE
jgi:hypothetical protein